MIRKFICILVKFISGLSVNWAGCKPEERQRIYFANHTSHFDFVALWAAFPDHLRKKLRPVAAKDYWEKGRLRKFIASCVINAVLIERKHISLEDENPLQAMLKALDEKCSLVIFPEGTRNTSDGDGIQPFKSGLYHLGRSRPDIEMVPIYLENLNRILPKGEFLMIPMLGTAIFGCPIQLKAEETKSDFLERARRAIEELKNEYHY